MDDKSKFLGMSFGKANNILRKNILFSLLKKYGENICFQCGKEIETSNQLSIEHKKPWQNIDVDLFFDIDNIAFSHLSCNIRAAAYGNKKNLGNRWNKREVPDGMSWCRIHNSFLSIEKFSKNKHNKNGLMDACKECERKRKKL